MSGFALIVGSGGLEHVPEEACRAVLRSFDRRAGVVQVLRPRPGVWLALDHDPRYERPAPVVRSSNGSGGALISDDPRVAESFSETGCSEGEKLGRRFLRIGWDGNAVRLMTDALGSRAAWWSQLSDGSFVASSEPRHVLAHPKVSREIDFGVVVERAAFRPSSPDRSVYAALRDAEPGSVVEVSEGRVSQSAWKRWPATIGSDRTPEEWAETILEVSRSVVLDEFERAASAGEKTALFLSGGLDSSVLAGLIAECEADAHTTALVRRYPGLSCDETEWQDHALRGRRFALQVIENRPIDPERDVFSVIEESEVPILNVEPVADDGSLWLSEQGIHTRISGVGGDELFVTFEETTLDALTDRDVHALLGTLKGASLSRTVRSHWRFLPSSVRFRLMQRQLPSWIRSEAAHDVGLAERIVRHHRLRPGGVGQLVARRELMRGGSWRGSIHERSEFGRAAFAANSVNPFFAPELVELLLRVPNRLRTIEGDSRGLQRLTYRSVLPEALLARRSKVFFDERHARDLAHPAFDAVFTSELMLAELGIIDAAAVRSDHAKLMACLRHGCELPPLSSRLWSILGVELWLRRFG